MKPEAAVRLRWDPAEPGDYMIQSYKVYRSTDGPAGLQPQIDYAITKRTLDLEVYDHTVDLGHVYSYAVAAVDSKLHIGALSGVGTVDLRALPAEKLAPRAPRGLTATSRKDDVKLVWRRADPWISPWSAYKVYRATSLAGLPKGFLVALTSSAMEVLVAPTAGTGTAQSGTATAQAESSTSQAWGSFGSGWASSFATTTATAQAATSTAQGASATAQSASATAQAAALAAVLAKQTSLNKDYFFYYDSPTAQKKDYYYAVTTLDADGHESPMSLTVLARATGPLPPGEPTELTATSKTEQVLLNWEPAAPGTGVLSGYQLDRRTEDSEHWRKVALLGVSTTTYSDSLDGGQAYIYRLAAFDAAGTTGNAAYIGASPMAKVLNNTLIITMPTAYADNKGYDTGFNLNIIFDFYVGSLFESYTSPITNQSQSSIFQELEIGTVTLDFKYAFLNDEGWVPGFAMGLYTSALIGFGGGTGESVGISSSGGGLSSLGDVYAVVSKRFMPSNPAAVVHAGIMHGDLASELTQSPIPTWAWPTLGHLMPGGSTPYLLTSFVDPSLGQTVGQSPNMAYLGLQFPFTVPLGFTRWRSGLRVEGLFPLGWEAQYPLNVANTATENGNPASQLPYLINIHVDNLPLFGFEFGLFEFTGGYEVIAFYHIPDLTWSW
jgi:fibronectin type 3 domain-containing protein